MILYDVKINGLENPIGFLLEPLVCSYKVKEAEGKKQSYVKIEVSQEEDFQTILYVKEGRNLSSLAEPLELKLLPYTRYFYRIHVTDDAMHQAVSETAFFETAKLSEEWTGKWIGMTEEDTFHPEFYKQFSIKKNMKKARLYICGLGLFEAYLNGKKAGTDLLAPFINDYKEALQYCTYDITELLAAQNELVVSLGNGWYKGRFVSTLQNKKEFLLRAEIWIQYEDGEIEIIGSDESFQYRGSIFEQTDIYDGEIQNYLLWDGKENPWKQAVLKTFDIPLIERYSLPLHEMEELPVKECIITPSGETVLDFGQNFAGYVECRQEIQKGKEMVFEFGEILQDGNFYNENYRSAKSKFVYVSDGIKRNITTHFTFFGFRYVKVSGLQKIQPELFIGRAVYSEMERTGYIETSHPKINQLYQNSLWSMKSNFLDMPTDCPQRDERLGWTGDAQVFSWTAAFHMDTRAFYRKYLRDLRSDQKRNHGKIAVFLPNTVPGFTASVWGDIGAFLPAMLYQYYGDKKELETNYPMMKDWVDSIHEEDKKQGLHHLYDFGFQFGDWLALDGATDQSIFGRTDSVFIASVYYYASACYVAEAAKILQKAEEEQQYSALADKIYQAVLAEFFTPNGRLSVDTQTGYLAALKFQLYRDKQKIIEGLQKRIKEDCFRIKGGFVGATMMNSVLAENGMADLAYDFLFFEDCPGWLYPVNLGATTIWERWNSVLPDGKMSGTGMNSLNHYAYGSVIEFLYRYAAGIAPETPGFQSIHLAPKPDARFQYFHCSYESASGMYVSNWRIHKDGTLSFHFEIPFGAKAKVTLPDSKMGTFELEAGSYDYTCQPERDYRILYHENTRLEFMLEDERARTILFEELPEIKTAYEKKDIETLSKSPKDLKKQRLQLSIPADVYDKVVQKLSVLHTLRMEES